MRDVAHVFYMFLSIFQIDQVVYKILIFWPIQGGGIRLIRLISGFEHNLSNCPTEYD